MEDQVDYWKIQILKLFDIVLSNAGGKDWTLANAKLMYESLMIMDQALMGQLRAYAGGSVLLMTEHDGDGDYLGTVSGTEAKFHTEGDDAIRQMNIFHEFGHLIDNNPNFVDLFSNMVNDLSSPSFINGDGEINGAALNTLNVSDPNFGTADALQHPSTSPVEQWADMFGNFVAGNISWTTREGSDMYAFVTSALLPTTLRNDPVIGYGSYR